jgi:hypothetical protein
VRESAVRELAARESAVRAGSAGRRARCPTWLDKQLKLRAKGKKII